MFQYRKRYESARNVARKEVNRLCDRFNTASGMRARVIRPSPSRPKGWTAFQYRKRYESARNQSRLASRSGWNLFQYRKRYESARNSSSENPCHIRPPSAKLENLPQNAALVPIFIMPNIGKILVQKPAALAGQGFRPTSQKRKTSPHF